MIVQGALSATHLLRKRTVRLYLCDADLICLHAPVEELSIIRGNTCCCHFHSGPVEVIVLRVAGGFLPMFLKIILALRDDLFDPGQDCFLLRVVDESAVANFEITDGDCAYDPALNI